jgi:hypothetical protein
VVRKALGLLDLPYSLHIHGLQRGIYAANLGTTSREWLSGKTRWPRLRSAAASDLAALAISRWVAPRAKRDETWRMWTPESFRLWPRLEKRRAKREPEQAIR